MPDPWMYDPVSWASDAIIWPKGQHLASYQNDILRAIPDQQRVAARGPHGLGKTTTVAIAVLWFATTRERQGIDWKILTTASAWRHLSVYAWPEIHKWAKRINWQRLGRPEFDDRRELLDLHLKLQSGAATAVASTDAANIEGAHADSLFYIFDEAKTIPDDIWNAAEGAFSGGRRRGLPEAFALAVSTPGAPQGRFYDIHSHRPGYEDWWTRHVTLEEAIKANRIDQGWAEQRKRQFGETSALYHNRVLGEFHAADEDSVIPLAWAEAAVERWRDNKQNNTKLEGKRALGVDVAASGADRTAIATRTGLMVESIEFHTFADTMKTTALVAAKLSDKSLTAIVDTIGVGNGVYARLRELNLNTQAFTGSAKTSQKDRTREWGFANTRSAALWRVRELLDPAFEPQLALPPDDTLLADLTAPTWEITTGSPPKIKVEPKDKVKERLGRSPDAGDAVAMALWADVHQIRAIEPKGQLVGASSFGPLA